MAQGDLRTKNLDHGSLIAEHETWEIRSLLRLLMVVLGCCWQLEHQVGKWRIERVQELPIMYTVLDPIGSQKPSAKLYRQSHTVLRRAS